MQHSIPADHAQHDVELIAAHAGGDLTETERARADALLATCTSCADVRRDLTAIALATRALPAPPAPPRDFRLTPAQAQELRRRGWIESLLRPFAAPRSTIRPMAMAFTSLGLAGLLVTSILPALLGGPTSLAPEAGTGGAAPAATAAAAAAASEAAAPVARGPNATDSRTSLVFGPQAQSTYETGTAGSKANEATTAPEVALGDGVSPTSQPYADRLRASGRDSIVEQTNPIAIGSLVLLAIGLSLFGLRYAARRAR